MPREFTDNSWQRTELKNFGLGLWDESVVSRAHIEQGACVSAQDVEWLPKGGMAKRSGIQKLNNAAIAASADIVQLFQWQTTTGADLIFVFAKQAQDTSCSGVYTAEIGSTDTVFSQCPVTDTLSAFKPDGLSQISCVAFLGSACFSYELTDGPIAVYGGGTVGTDGLTAMIASPSGCACLETWGNFILAGNTGDGSSRVSWCYPGNPWNDPLSNGASAWPGAYYLDLDPDDGDKIVAMKSFQDSIVVFKRHKMYQVSWVGGVNMFDYRRISTEIGCQGLDAVCEHNGKLWWLGPKGFYVWDGNQAPEDLSTAINPQIVGVDSSYAHFCYVRPYKKNGQIFVAFPKTSTTKFDVVYVYDYNLNSWTTFNISAYCMAILRESATKTFASFPKEYSYWDDVIASTAKRGADLVSFGYSGYAKRYGSGADDDGTAINASWKSGWLDWDMPDRNKRIIRTTFLVSVQGNSDYSLDVTWFKDWKWEDQEYAYTDSVSLYEAGAVSEKVVERRWDQSMYSRAAQLRLGTDGSEEPFTVHKIVIDWIAKGRTKG